jgi:hypothetical protein
MFSGQKFFGKADLRNFYQARSPALSEKAFRRILYALETRDLITSVDTGVYVLTSGHTKSRIPKKFSPTFSLELRELNDAAKTAFPYAEYLLWETRVLHEFMLHQPGQSQIILETETEVAESVFNFLNARFEGRVFLQPDRVTFERYILPRSDSIIVTPLFTQSPHQRVEDIPTPKIEKILVDIFTDEEIFYVFHGEELTHIFETAFEHYQVSQKTIFRYAKRRNADRKIRDFLQQKTNIQLIQQEGASE